MKKLFTVALIIVGALIIGVVVAGIIRFNFTDGGDIIPGKNATTVNLSCTNEYTGLATYYAPNKKGIMEKLMVVMVGADGIETQYDMIPAVSGSGAKFATGDGSFSLWEHQDEFTFVQGEQEIAVCKKTTDGVSPQPILDETPTSPSGDIPTNTDGNTPVSLGTKKWMWVSTVYTDGKTVVPNKTDMFGVTFDGNGHVTVSTDCNAMGGSYVLKGDTLTFSDMMSTLMYCEGSQELDFSVMLNQVVGAEINSEGILILPLRNKTGRIMLQ